jgi:transposase
MFSRIIVANAASRSGGMSSENKPGYDFGSNASPNSAMARNISSRRATCSYGNEPAQPAFPPTSTRLAGSRRRSQHPGPSPRSPRPRCASPLRRRRRRGDNHVAANATCSTDSDFPPWQTVYWYFNQWEQARVTEKILPVVRAQLRVREGRNPQPSAGLIDSQSVKGADTVGRDTRGYDAGKKINGRKRFPSPTPSGC